jgi:carbonic anhydrase
MFHSCLPRLCTLVLVAYCWAPPSRAQEAAPTPDKALERLKDGNARFVADKPITNEVGEQRRKELAKGQRPFAVILTCSDSRLAPEHIFDQGLGDIFVIRVAGNVTDPAIIGSIEYAVTELKSPLVVVLGHDECGAVKAALSGKKLPGDLGELIKLVDVGTDLPKDKNEALVTATKANIQHSATVLATKSDILKDFVASKRITIVTGIYSLESGKVNWLKTPEKEGKNK